LRPLPFLFFGGRGKRKALHMDVVGSSESGPVCVRVLQNSRAVDESGAVGPILFNWAVSQRQGSRWHWNKSAPALLAKNTPPKCIHTFLH